MIALFTALSLYCSTSHAWNEANCQDAMIACVQANWAARSRKGYMDPDEPTKIYLDCIADWKRK